MVRKNITRVIPAEEIRINLTFCDICEVEIPLTESSIEYNGRREASTSRIFLGSWASLFRGKLTEAKVDDNPLTKIDDFDVHYQCAVKAIAGAVKEKCL